MIFSNTRKVKKSKVFFFLKNVFESWCEICFRIWHTFHNLCSVILEGKILHNGKILKIKKNATNFKQQRITGSRFPSECYVFAQTI